LVSSTLTTPTTESEPGRARRRLEAGWQRELWASSAPLSAREGGSPGIPACIVRIRLSEPSILRQ
jgi:hypothetical protein